MLESICILSTEALNFLSTRFTNFELCPRNAANSDSELEVFFFISTLSPFVFSFSWQILYFCSQLFVYSVRCGPD